MQMFGADDVAEPELDVLTADQEIYEDGDPAGLAVSRLERRLLGQTFAGSIDGLLPTASSPKYLLDWELVPVSFLSVACRYGRKLHDGSACTPLSPEEGNAWPLRQRLPAFERPLDVHTFSGISYSSDYMARKAADMPALPWYGYEDGTDNAYGIWTSGPSSLISHAGFLLSFQGGHGNECPLRISYLRPGASLWRFADPPFAECCHHGVLRRDCLPSWLNAALGSDTHLHAPGVLYDPTGNLPDHEGQRRMHFSLYYSTSSVHAHSGVACIGRVSGRWLGADDTCGPFITWEDDQHPVLCSNVHSTASLGSETVWNVHLGPRFYSAAT